MSFAREVVVTFIAMAEQLGRSDEELRLFAHSLKQGEHPDDEDALTGLRIAEVYADARSRQAATTAFEVVSNQFATEDVQHWLVALEKVHLCIVPLRWR